MRKRLFRFPWRSGADIERELDDEIRFHLELRAAELQRRGMNEEDARREAERQFGDVEDARDYCRALAADQERALRRSHTVEAVVQDLRYMFRQIRRKPWFAMGTIAMLSIAIGISVVCFVYLRAYLLRPLPVPAPDRLVAVRGNPTRNFYEVPSPQGFDQLYWPEAYKEFEHTVSWDLDGFTLVGGDRSEYVDGAWVSPGFMPALTVRPSLGRPFLESDYREGAQVAMISHALWQRRFGGEPNVLGQVLVAHSTDQPNERISATIVGVLPERWWHFNRFTEVLLPLRTDRFSSLAVLRPGDSAEAVEERLTAWVRNQLPNADPRWRMRIESAQEEYVFAIRPALRVAFGACLLLLLVVCVNVAGLLLTQTSERRHELAVRCAIGAGRPRIVRQVVTECLAVAAIAAVIGVLLANMLLNTSRPLVEAQLRTVVPGAASVDVYALVFAAVVALVAAMIFGAGPAFLAARTQLQSGLSSTRWSTGTRRGLSLRAVFVAAQLAVCLALLGGSITLAQAALRLRNAQLGFAPEGVLKSHVLLPQARYGDAASRVHVVEEILQNAGKATSEVAIAFPHPFRPGGILPARLPGTPAREGINVTRVIIAGDYFGVMRIPVLEGRTFETRDRMGAERVAAVSKSLAQRLWPNTSAIGQQLRVGPDTMPPVTVVAVIGDVKKSLLDESTPDVYLPFAQSPQGYIGVLARGATDPMLLLSPVQEAIWRVDRDLPMSDVEPMTEVVAAETARHRFLSSLTSALAAFALILALLGLYATISYDVSQRAREFAIRSAVGARRAETYKLVIWRGARFMVVGIAAGALLAALVTRTLAGQIPAVEALGTLAQAGLSLAVIVLATLALVGPARRATGVDPATLLRE
jgi:putative ABC transport system permease protein